MRFLRSFVVLVVATAHVACVSTLPGPNGAAAIQPKTLDVTVQLPAGTLKLSGQHYRIGRTVVQDYRGEMNGQTLRRQRYSFDGENGMSVVRAQDGEHSVTFAVSNTAEPDIGRLVVWHDEDVPRTFLINTRVLADTRDLRAAVTSGNAEELDVVGRRHPPNLTRDQLREALQQNEQFMQWIPPGELPPEDSVTWKCWIWCLIPACGIICLGWAAG